MKRLTSNTYMYTMTSPTLNVDVENFVEYISNKVPTLSCSYALVANGTGYSDGVGILKFSGNDDWVFIVREDFNNPSSRDIKFYVGKYIDGGTIEEYYSHLDSWVLFTNTFATPGNYHTVGDIITTKVMTYGDSLMMYVELSSPRTSSTKAVGVFGWLSCVDAFLTNSKTAYVISAGSSRNEVYYTSDSTGTDHQLSIIPLTGVIYPNRNQIVAVPLVFLNTYCDFYGCIEDKTAAYHLIINGDDAYSFNQFGHNVVVDGHQFVNITGSLFLRVS